MSDREESAMGDERLTETVARAIREAPMRATLRGGNVIDPTAPLTDGELNRGRAALAAIRNAGFAIVATEGEGFEAAVDRMIAAIIGAIRIRDGYIEAEPTAEEREEFALMLRAALSPGDDANG